MRHTQCLLTPARALHRVLLLELANTASTSTGVLSTKILPSSPAFRRHASLPTSKQSHTLGITAVPQCSRARPFSTTSPASSARMIVKKKNLRDHEIPYNWVHVASDSGSLSEPQRTAVVIANLPRGHSLVMVGPPPEGAAAPNQPSAAICRIIDVAAEAKAAEAAAKEAKEVQKGTKTLELNWAIAAHDLSHKMRRLNEFLGKGMRVELLLARKRGTRKATAEEGQELVRRVREAVANVPGASEFKKMNGVVGGVLMMFFEGPKRKS
ncbi:hypothetical protein F4803DRAFT_518538 [Xylaria telfairii]|nr:hypothetical protein F4803DRAFT_518538 [Xylaria telfairii]